VVLLGWNFFYRFVTISDLVCSTVEDLRSVEEVTKALRTPLASKQYGYEDFLAKLISKACGKSAIMYERNDSNKIDCKYARVVERSD